jgi:hypothetical protein
VPEESLFELLLHAVSVVATVSASTAAPIVDPRLARIERAPDTSANTRREATD